MTKDNNEFLNFL